MSSWSAENATNAYLRAMKMVKRAKEPDASEFISALVAGTNARLMVVACAEAADSATLALVAAAHQTGGKVVCILAGNDELQSSKEILGESAADIEFVIGDAEILVASEYRESDCIVVDCRIENCEKILKNAKKAAEKALILGYHAFGRCVDGFDGHLLPIGEGLLLSRVAVRNERYRCKKSRWVVKVDKFTGEEHVFRVR